MNNASSRRSPSRIRSLAALVLAGVFASSLGGCSKPGPSASDVPVRIGYSAWPGWFPWKVSEEKGLFTAAGVPVTLTWFDGYLCLLYTSPSPRDRG